MQLDIRIPIGLLFTILGVVIGGYGLALIGSPSGGYSPDTMGIKLYEKMGMNLNLWSGLGLLAFGLLMLVPAIIAQKKKAAAAQAAAEKPEEAKRT